MLKKIFDGDIFLGVDKNYPGYFENIKNVNIYNVQGPHPSGDVCFHIHIYSWSILQNELKYQLLKFYL